MLRFNVIDQKADVTLLRDNSTGMQFLVSTAELDQYLDVELYGIL